MSRQLCASNAVDAVDVLETVTACSLNELLFLGHTGPQQQGQFAPVLTSFWLALPTSC